MKLIAKASDVFYDVINDKLIVFSGYGVEDSMGQPALFCLDKEPRKNARVTHGCIYTAFLFFESIKSRRIINLGNVESPDDAT